MKKLLVSTAAFVFTIFMITHTVRANDLSFLEQHPDVKAKLLQWEQEAPQEVKAKIEVLKRKGGPAPHRAAEELGAMGPQGKGAILALMEVWSQKPSVFDLHHPEDKRLRAKATGALAKIGEPTVEPMIAALDDETQVVRIQAIKVLGEIGDARATAPLLAAMMDENGLVRVVAAKAVKDSVDRYTLKFLVSRLEDEDRSVREAAVTALEDLQQETHAVEPLLGALTHQDDRVQREAAGLLEKKLRKMRDRDTLVQFVDWAIKKDYASLNNQICWFGSLNGFPDIVLPACERAVQLMPEDGGYRDSRGLALALTGDSAEAVEDFQFALEWGHGSRSESWLTQRADWIRELKAGRNPFDLATIVTLRKE
jgi:hypothetical protein